MLSLCLGLPLANKTFRFGDLRRGHFHRRGIAAFDGVCAGVRIGASHGRHGEPFVGLDVVAGQAGAFDVHPGETDLGKRIALLGDSRYESIAFRNSAERRYGYRLALLEAGLAPDPTLDVSGPFGLAGGSAAIAELFSAGNPPTAVFAEFDEMAYGGLRTLRSLGHRVPDDVSIIGVDDHEMADMMDLTTMRQPVHDQGRQAAQLLLELLDETRSEPVDIVMPTELIVRGTTGPVRTVTP